MNERLKGQTIFEKKGIRNGVEMPIQCLLRDTKEKDLIQRRWHPHYHEYIEFLFGLEACEVNAWIAGENVRFGAGDLLVINAGVAHYFEHLTQQTRYLCFKVLPEVLCFSCTDDRERGLGAGRERRIFYQRSGPPKSTRPRAGP